MRAQARTGPHRPYKKQAVTKKKFKGNGWSRGSKASRRAKRFKSKAVTKSYFVVTSGWRPGIYRILQNARAQLLGNENPMLETFSQLSQYIKFSAQNRQHASPRPFHHRTSYFKINCFLETVVFGVPVTPEVTAAVSAFIDQMISQETNDESLAILHRVREIQSNQVLDPSCCEWNQCPYSFGPLKEQRFVLLERLYQINCVLSQLQRRSAHV